MAERHREQAQELRLLEQRAAPAGRGNAVLVVAASLLSAVAAGAFAVSVVTDASVTVQGSALAVALLSLAFALRRAFAAEYPHVLASEERHASPAPGGPLATVRPLRRRTVLVRVVVAAAALFGLSLLAPVSSLGTPRRTLQAVTAWRAGVRLVDGDGEPLRVDDVGEVAVAWPEGRERDELDAVIVVRLGDEQPEPPTRLEWMVGGALVAYSKICTHAGCPVGLYQAERAQLFCPCHQASFDAARGAIPTFGPAARALPQLPLGANRAGELVALGDFAAPVGPYVGGRERDVRRRARRRKAPEGAA